MMSAETIATMLEYMDLRQFFKDNSPVKLLIIAGAVIVAWGFAHVLVQFLQKKLEKMAAASATPPHGTPQPLTGMDFEMFERLMRNIRILLYVLIWGWAMHQLTIGPLYARLMNIIFTACCIWAGILFLTAFVPFNIDMYLRSHGATLKTSQARSLMPITKGVIWAVGLTFLLDNLGFQVSTIIAGLGIAGVAAGLAGQAILADFFSYVVILLDKPFRIGDFVEIGEGKSGQVEYMGPKTTHLRDLNDDLIVCSNSELTRGLLVNQGSIHEREVILNVGMAYDTPLDKIKKFPEMMRDTINSFPFCSFDRACLLDFGDSNLLFQIIYQVGQQRGGIREFMNTRSAVNMAILEKFAIEDISMAYPTEHVLFTNLNNKPDSKPAPKQKSGPDAGAED